MRPLILLTLAFTLQMTLPSAHAQADSGRGGIIRVSQDFLYAARVGEPVDSFRRLLESGTANSLAAELNTEAKRLAFWLNIYNAATQSALKVNAAQYKNRNAFFKKNLINIAGRTLSLDDIEHGILRRSKAKLSLGYFGKLFPSRYEKTLRVDKLDPRIHFALNCGARSCPPIAFYDDTRIEEQLDVATLGHLKAETKYDSVKNTIALPAFMGWFRADFGGKHGIRKLLWERGIVPRNKQPRITFQTYDWDLYLNNYRE